MDVFGRRVATMGFMTVPLWMFSGLRLIGVTYYCSGLFRVTGLCLSLGVSIGVTSRAFRVYRSRGLIRTVLFRVGSASRAQSCEVETDTGWTFWGPGSLCTLHWSH